ncbi:MAG: hypothetical protein ACK4K9_04285 [Bacteroidia bacterium]
MSLFQLIIYISSCEEIENRFIYAQKKIEGMQPKTHVSKFKLKNKIEKTDSFVEEDLSKYNYKNQENLIYREEKIWAQNKTTHLFSDTIYNDKFSLKIIGDKDFAAMAYFTISQNNNKVIFIDSFPFIDLLAIKYDGGGYFATETQQEKFASNYAANFFSENNFKPITQFIMNESNEEISVNTYSFTYRINKNKTFRITCNYTDKKIDKIEMY